MSTYKQMWPEDNKTGGEDFLAGTKVFEIAVSSFPFGTYGFSMTGAPVGSPGATITIEELFRSSGHTEADFFPVPVAGELLDPAAGVLQSLATFTDRAIVRLRFTVTATVTLPGFALYAQLDKRTATR